MSAMARSRSSVRRWIGALGFPVAFVAYTSVAIGLLLFGLGPALGDSRGVRESLESAVASGGALGTAAMLVLRARPYSEPAIVLALDYALSALNIAVGVFIVVRRGDQWAPRLLGIGMVGTALAFNLQMHGLIVAEIQSLPLVISIDQAPLNLIHIGYHAVSGAAYATAFLLLPNSTLIPRWLRWPVLVVYLVLVEEILVPVAGFVVAHAARPGLLMGWFDDAFGIKVGSGYAPLESIVNAEVVFLVLFFGLLIPAAGLFSGLSRYPFLGAAERAETRLIVFALVIAFSAGFVFILVSAASVVARGTALAPGDAENLRRLVFRVFPPIYAVIPPVVVAAIARYRLYEIDILINRAVLYGSVTAMLAVAFGALNATAQRAVEALTGDRSDLVAIVIGLGLVLTFNSIRKRSQPVVDRLLPSRGVLTFLFTDIVGSTSRVIELGDDRWRRMLDLYRATVRHDLARFGGREVDTAGDGFFATFDRPVPALRCAVRLRRSLHRIGLDSRMGVHTGECELRGERVSGVNVIVAARLMALARANQIVVSAEVRGLAEGSDLEFTEHGTEQLKGVPGDWRVQLLDPV